MSPERQLLITVAFALLALGSSGCGDRLYPVRGTVALEDGTPVTKGMIVIERTDGGEPLTAQGEIMSDGSYQLSTNKPGDGVPPGKYRVLINAMDLSDLPDEQKDNPFVFKYLSFKSSGLEIEVMRGDIDYPIRRAKSPRRAKLTFLHQRAGMCGSRFCRRLVQSNFFFGSSPLMYFSMLE